MAKKKRNKKQQMVRIVAIVLAVLLAGGAIVSAVISMASAEELPRNRQEIEIEYLENEQALRVSQRLVYVNASSVAVDRVVFYAPVNMFRRQSALMYGYDELEAAFPEGYLPGGIDLTDVRVDGEAADYGFQGENETALRVECALGPGEGCTFDLEYYILLTKNSAFCGVGKSGARLSDFLLIPAAFDDETEEYLLNAPLAFTRYICTNAADYFVEVTLPKGYALSCGGLETGSDGAGDALTHTVVSENARDLALAFDRDKKQYSRESASGVMLSCLSSKRGQAEKALSYVEEAIGFCEKYFGAFPYPAFSIAETESVPDALSFTGALWLSPDALRGDDLRHDVCTAVARQYFGNAACVQFSQDAWLSDAVAEYVYYLIVEESQGHDGYLKELNARVVDALQLTIPGGLRVNSEAALMSSAEYDTVVRERGAAVFHEMRTSMGRDALLASFRRFYEMGADGHFLTELELAQAMEDATGKSWEKELTDWVLNIGEYVNQDIDWLD